LHDWSLTLQNSRPRCGEHIAVRKFFRSDVEGIESVGAVGAVFEQVFFVLYEFFTALTLRTTPAVLMNFASSMSSHESVSELELPGRSCEMMMAQEPL